MVAKSPADGYTLLMSYVGTQAINGSVYRSLPFDPYQDFATLATVATVPFALVVNQQFPARNMPELVAYAKAHPGQVHFGSAGNGSLNQLLGEMAPPARPRRWSGRSMPTSTKCCMTRASWSASPPAAPTRTAPRRSSSRRCCAKTSANGRWS
jgi:hypothetical protein